MLHPSTIPIPNVKLKIVSKVYNGLYNNNVGKTRSKCECTKESTIKVCALLYHIHMTTYNFINCKCPCFLIMNFYRLVRFHIQRYFRARPSVRVSDSVHPVTYVIQFFTKNPGPKIYCRMPVGSTNNYILLHIIMINIHRLF